MTSTVYRIASLVSKTASA